MSCTVIDMKKTGELLKATIHDAGYDVKYIQEHLQMSCPSAIYKWYKGKILPSIDHLYSLSVLLDMHMEDLIVQKNFEEKED